MGKSIFRRPGTRHFHLVHRSQRDPLINDPEASSHVLREVVTGKRKEEERSEQQLAESDADSDIQDDPASYGIFFNDTDYDYMQHLRLVGQHSDTVLIEAPKTATKERRKDDRSTVQLRDEVELPEDALPSHPLDEMSYLQVTESKANTTGLLPDIDPSVKEVLEALDDEAYVERAFDEDDGLADGGEDDDEQFWSALVSGIAMDNGQVTRSAPDTTEGAFGVREQWADVYAARNVRKMQSDDEQSSFDDEEGDEVPDLVNFYNSKRTRDDLSSASMSSSALFRNEGLRLLDDRFDKVEQDYEDSDEDSLDDRVTRDDHEADVEAIMEALEGRLKLSSHERTDLTQALTRKSRARSARAQQELSDLRRNLAGADDPQTAAIIRERILARREDPEEAHQVPLPVEIRHDSGRIAWDCETVLSTYSNLSNHPRKIRALRSVGAPRERKIQIDSRTGMPQETTPDLRGHGGESEEADSDHESWDRPSTVTRPRGESAEERRARKQAVKQDRAARRTEKKSTKAAFADETRKQKRSVERRTANGAHADVRGDGVRRIA